MLQFSPPQLRLQPPLPCSILFSRFVVSRKKKKKKKKKKKTTGSTALPALAHIIVHVPDENTTAHSRRYGGASATLVSQAWWWPGTSETSSAGCVSQRNCIAGGNADVQTLLCMTVPVAMTSAL